MRFSVGELSPFSWNSVRFTAGVGRSFYRP
jgi:hypothetical protein